MNENNIENNTNSVENQSTAVNTEQTTSVQPTEKKKGCSPIVIVVIVILLLALIGIGVAVVILLVGNKQGNGNSTTQTTTITESTTTTPQGGTYDVDKLVKDGKISINKEKLKEVGISKHWYLTRTDEYTLNNTKHTVKYYNDYASDDCTDDEDDECEYNEYIIIDGTYEITSDNAHVTYYYEPSVIKGNDGKEYMVLVYSLYGAESIIMIDGEGNKLFQIARGGACFVGWYGNVEEENQTVIKTTNNSFSFIVAEELDKGIEVTVTIENGNAKLTKGKEYTGELTRGVC